MSAILNRFRKSSAALQQANEAVLKSKQASQTKAVNRSIKLGYEQTTIRAALGGVTPISEKGLQDRPTPPILPPDYRAD